MAEVTKSKAIVLGMLFKVDVANPNAGWTEENVTPLKKIETPDNRRHPYISGQALRRYLRDTMADIVEFDDSGKALYQFSPEEPGPDPKSPILTAGRPDLYIDDDLFGFMRAVKGRGKTSRRESPLRVSAGFGLFPYAGDLDLGTRTALKVTHDPEAGGAVFETEVTNNVFRTTWLLELDRIGRWLAFENAESNPKEWGKAEGSTLPVEVTEITLPKQKSFEGQLSLEERRKRAQALLRAVKYLYGGARQARLFIELVPQMLIYARVTKKIALFLNTLQVNPINGQYELTTAPLEEVLKDYAGDIRALIVGLRDGFLINGRDALLTSIKDALGEKQAEVIKPQIYSIGNAVDAMVKDICKAEF
jgi:CRISPR-associated protein Cst2